MIDRCHWVREPEGFEVLIPMCHGSAAYGSSGCTCTVPSSRIERAERGRAEAERYVMKLREARDEMLDRQKTSRRFQAQLHQRVRELEALLKGQGDDA
jgi:hypothetical protein